MPINIYDLVKSTQIVGEESLKKSTDTEKDSKKEDVNETIRQIDYQTGWSYTVTGTNINIPATPQVGTPYTIYQNGAPFQFSETYSGPGMIKDTTVIRSTSIMSVTDTTSVFTQ